MSHLPQRPLGPFNVSAIGFGCMNISHAYGNPPEPDVAAALLERAFEAGINFFDTAALYGFGSNEELLGKTFLKKHRSEIVLASKGGMAGVDGKRVINGRPEAIRKNCEESLRRLQTDVIDFYYLHRWDKKIPIEDSVGEMSRLVEEGKVRAIGLSEVSARTIEKAHKIHPIAAVQTEYSLWTRNPEIAVLETCKDLGIAFVAFSPVARGFLGGKLLEVNSLDAKDIRRGMPRFYPENYRKNLEILRKLQDIAQVENCSIAQLSLAWLLAKGNHIIPIPGTTKVEHLMDNIGSLNITLSSQTIASLDLILNENSVVGARYNEATQTEIDTEEFI